MVSIHRLRRPIDLPQRNMIVPCCSCSLRDAREECCQELIVVLALTALIELVKAAEAVAGVDASRVLLSIKRAAIGTTLLALM